ncbi:MAG: putative glycoside hydrolase [Fibrobacterota bacterium]
MRTAIFFIFFLLSSLAAYPRTANYYLAADWDSLIMDSLSRCDLVVLDMELGNRAPKLLEYLRDKNPEITVLAYMTVQEINPAVKNWDNSLRQELFEGIAGEWFLRDTAGDTAVFWEGTKMLNASVHCPEVNGQTWGTYFADFITRRVLATGLWDGFYFDNCWGTVAWVDDALDADNDATADFPRALNAAWQKGMKIILKEVRRQNPEAVLMGNGGWHYGEYLNGVLFEDFPRWGGWDLNMHRYLHLDSILAEPRYTSINATTASTGDIDSTHWVYTLCSALMGGGYYCYDFGAEDHSQNWWHPLYDVDLGSARGPAQELTPGRIAQIDFESGIGNWVSAEDGESSTNPLKGSKSLSCYNSTGNEWYEPLKSPELFTAGQRIYVSFRYRVDSLKSDSVDFSFFLRSETGGYQKDVFLGNLFAPKGTVARAQAAGTVGNYDDYRLCFSIRNRGGVTLDDIEVHSTEDAAMERRFDNGIVVVNNGRSTREYRSPEPMINARTGDTARTWYIPPAEGRILLFPASSALVSTTSAAGPSLFSFDGKNVVWKNSPGMNLSVYDVQGRLRAGIADASARGELAFPSEGVYIVQAELNGRRVSRICRSSK